MSLASFWLIYMDMVRFGHSVEEYRCQDESGSVVKPLEFNSVNLSISHQLSHWWYHEGHLAAWLESLVVS